MRYLTRFYGYKADCICTRIAHDFPAAAQLYSEAIEKNPLEPTLWCNRAYARMKLEEFGYALTDASTYLAQACSNAYLIIFQVKQYRWILNMLKHTTGKSSSTLINGFF